MAKVPAELAKLRIAFVYDRVNSWGGAERVLLALHSLFPAAPLYTSVSSPNQAEWARDWEVRTSFLQSFSWARRRHRLLGWTMPVVFESFDFSDFDIIVSVTSEAAKGIITQPHQLHICYLLTPTRYLWSHQQEYRQQLAKPLQPLVSMLQHTLQKWDRVAAQRPDVIIPISRLVQERAQKYYQREVVAPMYPPVPSLPSAKPPKYRPNQPFFFTWGRHVPYKRFDLIIEAAVLQQTKVVIAGEGPLTEKLQRLAQHRDPQHNWIEFVGQVSDSELSWYLQQAKAAVFPQIEDFGIAPLEAVSLGCPVIVHQQSGAAELLSSRSAVFLASSTLPELEKAWQSISKKSWRRLDIAREAREYAEESFQQNWQEQMTRLWQQHQKLLKG